MYQTGVVPGVHYCMSFDKRAPYGTLLLKDIKIYRDIIYYIYREYYKSLLVILKAQSRHNEIFQLICILLDGLNKS